MRVAAITLPYPPSANRYWRQSRYGGVHVSKEATAYKKQVALLCLHRIKEPLTGDLRMIIDVYRPMKKGDLSNRIKVLEDAMIGSAYNDDDQIVEIIARRFDDKTNPRVEVEITQIR